MAWPTDWHRGAVLDSLMEASGVSLSVQDPLPDTLIAQAQELGLTPIDLKLWIYDSPRHAWTSGELARWARQMQLGVHAVEPEGDSTDELPDRDDGVQEKVL